VLETRSIASAQWMAWVSSDIVCRGGRASCKQSISVTGLFMYLKGLVSGRCSYAVGVWAADNRALPWMLWHQILSQSLMLAICRTTKASQCSGGPCMVLNRVEFWDALLFVGFHIVSYPTMSSQAWDCNIFYISGCGVTSDWAGIPRHLDHPMVHWVTTRHNSKESLSWTISCEAQELWSRLPH
jgi:hypothetical protein